METKDETIYYEKKQEFSKKGNSKLKMHLNRGLTAFLVVAMSILFYFVLFRLEGVSDIFYKIVDILKPIIYGLGMAYLLNPIVRRVDGWLAPKLEKKMVKEKAKKTSRTIAISLALIFLVLLVYALCAMMVPELYRSIRNLVYNLPRQIDNAVELLDQFRISSIGNNTLVNNIVKQTNEMFQNWIHQDMFTQIESLMSNVTIGVFNVVGEVFDFLVGLIVSVYVLYSKETFSAQCKKLTYAFMPTDRANLVLHLTTKSNEMFSGFIIGKIIDSAIIGVLCFVGLTWLDMPYTLLVSVIVGTTNVIPFFGPFIGAIPSSILIILADPIKGLYFIGFVFLLQQLDGNVIGPKILGDSTGLSSFWVIFSILLFGGLFGVLGMIIGVPTFAVIYYIVDMITKEHLERKNLPTASSAYKERSYVDNKGNYVDMDAKESAEK